MRHALFVALLVLSATSLSSAQITGEIREGNIILFAEQPTVTGGLDFISPAGNLIPIPDPPGSGPFLFFLSNTPNQITMGNLGSGVELDGPFNTFAGYRGDPTGDLTAFWGKGAVPTAFDVTLSAEPIPDNIRTPEVVAPPRPDPPVTTPDPIPTHPNPEGLVTGEIREETILLFSSESVPLSGIDFQSAAGNLVPIDERLGASPFQFMLSNTPNQITVGNLRTVVNLDGAFNTNAGYVGDPAGDLVAQWGNGSAPVLIPVVPSVEAIPADLVTPPLPPVTNPDPPIIIEPPISIDPPRPPRVDVHPNPEGLVTGEVREGKIIVFSSESVPLSGLDFQSPAGNLVPGDNQLAADPFMFFVANTANQIVVGNLGTTVELDGALNTNIGYLGDPAGDLSAFWGNGPDPISFPVTQSSEAIPGDAIGGTPTPTDPPVDPPTDPPVDLPTEPPVLQPDPPEGDPVSGFINDEGFLVLAIDGTANLSGLDLQSAAGNLTPIEDPPGSAPFQFFLSNTPNRITWGNLGSTVTLEGEWVTPALYDGDPATDLTAVWGNGATGISFAVSPSDAGFGGDVGNPIVPEPSSMSLASLAAAVALLGSRRKRR